MSRLTASKLYNPLYYSASGIRPVVCIFEDTIDVSAGVGTYDLLAASKRFSADLELNFNVANSEANPDIAFAIFGTHVSISFPPYLNSDGTKTGFAPEHTETFLRSIWLQHIVSDTNVSRNIPLGENISQVNVHNGQAIARETNTYIVASQNVQRSRFNPTWPGGAIPLRMWTDTLRLNLLEDLSSVLEATADPTVRVHCSGVAMSRQAATAHGFSPGVKCGPDGASFDDLVKGGESVLLFQ